MQVESSANEKNRQPLVPCPSILRHTSLLGLPAGQVPFLLLVMRQARRERLSKCNQSVISRLLASSCLHFFFIVYMNVRNIMRGEGRPQKHKCSEGAVRRKRPKKNSARNSVLETMIRGSKTGHRLFYFGFVEKKRLYASQRLAQDKP